MVLIALKARSHHPVRRRPSSEELQTQKKGQDTRKPIELIWWSAWDFCRVVNCSLCAFLGFAHFSVCHRTSHSTMLPVLWCRKRRNPFMKSGLCKALYTTFFWPICHYLYNGPYCAFLGLDKVACVWACMYVSAKDTPWRPWAPGMPVPGSPHCSAPMAPHSGQLHLAHQGHFTNQGHLLSLLFQGEEKVLIWFPPLHCWFIYKACQKWAGYLFSCIFDHNGLLHP